MTRRYTSGFDILGFDTDPTPGDPDIIMSQIVPTYQSIGDDAEAALNALNSDAVQNGAGQTMQALQNLIGTSYPPKLQTCADSYHSAASIYTVYAQALSEAQNQLDRAMDQAVPVAAMANATVQPAPPNASADQVAAVQQQQQSVDQANDQLTAAKQLAQDAADMRTQAGNTFNTNLNDVSAIPAPTPPSWWQDLVNAFNTTFFQIFLDITIAVASIFFPVVGLALGVLVFGLSTGISIASGNFDAGTFVTGLFTLAVGGLAAVGAFAKLGSAIAKAAEGAETAGGNFFSTAAGSAAKGIQSVTNAIGKLNPVVKGVLGSASDFGVDVANQYVSNAIDHKQGNVQEVLGGAAVGAVVGHAISGAKGHFGFGDEPDGAGSAPSATPSPESSPGSPPSPTASPEPPSPPAAPATPGTPGSPVSSSHPPLPAPEPPSPVTPESPVSSAHPPLPAPQPPSPEPHPAGAGVPSAGASPAQHGAATSGSPGHGLTWVSSSKQAGGNAFEEGGKLVGGLAEAGTQAGIEQSQGGDPSGVFEAGAAGLEPGLVGIPIRENAE